MAKKKYELDFEDVHLELLNGLIPFFGNNIDEVITYASKRFIEEFVFKNKYSTMREELKRMDSKK